MLQNIKILIKFAQFCHDGKKGNAPLRFIDKSCMAPGGTFFCGNRLKWHTEINNRVNLFPIFWLKPTFLSRSLFFDYFSLSITVLIILLIDQLK